jgi:hemolysin III
VSQCEHERIRTFPAADDPEARFTLAMFGPVPPSPRRRPSRLNFLSFEHQAASRAAPVWFAAFIGGQLALLLAFIRYFFRPTWDAQWASGWTAIVLTGLACSLMLCFGEYFFHRYILHIETVRFLRSVCRSHLTHHKLTFIKFDETTATVRSGYPITDVEHDDQSTFPPWALVPFFAFFTPFFAPMAFSFPRLPILIGGYTAIAIAHCLYELLHAAHHQPYESFWKPRIEHPRLGRLWSWLYGFHQAHHANYKCNLNVAGFFGVPLADLAFGTYRQPDPLLVDGAPATKAHARRLTPSPRWPIAWLDRIVFKRRRWMVKRP